VEENIRAIKAEVPPVPTDRIGARMPPSATCELGFDRAYAHDARAGGRIRHRPRRDPDYGDHELRKDPRFGRGLPRGDLMTGRAATAAMHSPDDIRMLMPADEIADPEVTILVPALDEELIIAASSRGVAKASRKAARASRF